jgi:hypothetical protein
VRQVPRIPVVHRVAAFVAVAAFLGFAAVASADGPPPYVVQGNSGVVGPLGLIRYVAVGDGHNTIVEAINVPDGSVRAWTTLHGYWGIPAIDFGPQGGEGLSHNGKALVVATFGGATTSFVKLSTHDLRVIQSITLPGNFAYDALSPDASKLYLIEHTDQTFYDRYVVRAYDLRHGRLLPGRIADRTQKSWTMQGSPVKRITSPDGRWVYTLYQNPGGYPFIHALDTVRGVAHCTGLPWTGDQANLWGVVLRLNGTKLAVDRTQGRAWLTLDARTWRLAPATHGWSFPWRWLALGVGVLAAFAALALATRLRAAGSSAVSPARG